MSNRIDCSIIIPSYQAKDTIIRALRSCLAQHTSFEYEVIIILNGEDDGSEDLINNIENPKIKVKKINEPGRSKARNLGIKIALGKYIQFLDADDEIETNKIDKSIEFLERNDVYAAYCMSMNIVKEGQNEVYKVEQTKLRELEIFNPFLINSIVYRKDELVLFDERFEYNEDWLFWYDLLNEKKIYIDNNTIGGNIHIHGDNTMKNKDKMIENLFYIRGIIRKKSSKKYLFLLDDIKLYILFHSLIHFKGLEYDENKFDMWPKGFFLLKFLFYFPIVSKRIEKRTNNILTNNIYN